VPGLYLLAILLSTAGIALLDRRFALVLWMPNARARALVAVGIGTAFFLAWDAVGISTGVFVKGDSPLYIGIEIAPHLPLEEIFFLAFLCYLALVTTAAAGRGLAWRSRRPPASSGLPRSDA
jgi:lycopene cyclase domain-containing protein